jgi:hypothetical protein
VALAQDLFSSDVDDGGEISPPPTRAGRMRKAAGKEGRLARMVRELRGLEDHIAAKLAATQRHLTQLETRRVHIDAGYTSEAEFEERMLAVAPFLRAMRDVVPPSAKLAAAPSGRRESADERARKTKALTAVGRTHERVRATDAEIHDSAAKARAKLCAIEGMRTFEECGYSSFDEFLERALGPSPVLSSAVALIAAEPLVVSTESEDNQRVSEFDAETLAAAGDPEPGEEPGSEGPLAADGESGAFAPSVFGETESAETPGLFDEPIDAFSSSSSNDDAGDAGPSSLSLAAANDSGSAPAKSASRPPEKQAAAAPAKRKAGMIASLALCLVGIIGGAAGGAWGAIASDRAHALPAATADAKHPGEPETAVEGKAAEGKGGEGKAREGKSSEAKPSAKKALDAKIAEAKPEAKTHTRAE